MNEINTISDLRAAWQQIAKQFEQNPFLAFEFIERPEDTIQTLGYRLMEPARTALLRSLPA